MMLSNRMIGKKEKLLRLLKKNNQGLELMPAENTKEFKNLKSNTGARQKLTMENKEKGLIFKLLKIY